MLMNCVYVMQESGGLTTKIYSARSGLTQQVQAGNQLLTRIYDRMRTGTLFVNPF